MLEQLIGKGRGLKGRRSAYSLETLYGANRTFGPNHIPHIGRLLEPDFERVAAWADAPLITQKPSGAMRRIIENSQADPGCRGRSADKQPFRTDPVKPGEPGYPALAVNAVSG